MIEQTESANLEIRVEKYLRTNARKIDEELAHFRRLRLQFAIEEAAKAIGPDGKMLGHQHRVGAEICAIAAERLVACQTEIESCKSFDELLDLIGRETADVEGFGVLARYDTALRIGAKLTTPEINVMPTVVYLHAGTKEGARRLGFYTDQEYLTMEEIAELHPELLRLEKPDYIESFLCWSLHN